MHYFRMIHIVFVALRFGLDDFIHEHAPLKPLRKLIQILFFWRNKQQARGERLRLALEKLGPIFVTSSFRIRRMNFAAQLRTAYPAFMCSILNDAN